jgi:hypothetical protein
LVMNDGSRDLDRDEGVNYSGTTPTLFPRDAIFNGESLVVYTGHQHVVYDELTINAGAEMIINGTVFVLE